MIVGISLLCGLTVIIYGLKINTNETIQKVYRTYYLRGDQFGGTNMEDSNIEEFRHIHISNNSYLNPEQKSNFAYITLISGIDKSLKYRGFLLNTLIAKRALLEYKSTADFIVLLGFSELDQTPYQSDINLLHAHGIITHILPRLIDETLPLKFAEMALLKITPWSLTQYDRIQFFDGDVMPLKNMDCFFQLTKNTFTVGAVSPLNSGWFLCIPDGSAYSIMAKKAIWRLTHDWGTINGWGKPIPKGLLKRDGKEVKKWDFNGADMDQGLLTFYYVMTHGDVILINNEKQLTEYALGILRKPGKKLTIKNVLKCCENKLPSSFFAHFTGIRKPWMMDSKVFLTNKKNSAFVKWANILDSLRLPVNSTNVASMGLGSPLGFWNKEVYKKGNKKNK